MFLTLLLILNTSPVQAAKHKKIAKVEVAPGPSLLQFLTELKPLVEIQAKKCDEWIEDLIDIVPSDARGKNKYPVSILPKLFQRVDEFPGMSGQILERLETISLSKLKSENPKDESLLLNRIESEVQRCSPLSSVAFLNNLIESIPASDTETQKMLSMKFSEKIAPEVEGGGFFPTTLIQAGLLESSMDNFPDRGSWFSSRMAGVLKRGQKLKLKYHKKLLDTSIEESASQYLKIKLDGLKDAFTLRQQLRMILTDAGLRREKKKIPATAPIQSPSQSPSIKT
ncbi:MAG: hypothetical protein KA715_04895 [Xanthomonadaceae bacterium]|nr:hypothetical protein [Xanthomonadaceae bacterium]